MTAPIPSHRVVAYFDMPEAMSTWVRLDSGLELALTEDDRLRAASSRYLSVFGTLNWLLGFAPHEPGRAA